MVPHQPALSSNSQLPPPASPSQDHIAPESIPSLTTLSHHSFSHIVFSLVQQTFAAINDSHPELMQECSPCYHSSPPFYEGIGIPPNNFTLSTEYSFCHWQHSSFEGFSLEMVSGSGTYVTPPKNKLPPTFACLCNQTQTSFNFTGDFYLFPLEEVGLLLWTHSIHTPYHL